jgi:hypothetical protein
MSEQGAPRQAQTTEPGAEYSQFAQAFALLTLRVLPCARVRRASREARVAASRRGEGNATMSMGIVVVLGIASIFFFSALLITAALMVRGRWDSLGQTRQRPKD